MAMLAPQSELVESLRRQRDDRGDGRYDEVWKGLYVMNPMPNLEHQRLVLHLSSALAAILEPAGQGVVYPGANVSDLDEGWERNYRCPDVLAYLKGNPAKALDTHFQGGPDFLVEIVSPGDHSFEKLDFYAKVGVREALIISRAPWRLDLFRLEGGVLKPAGQAGVGELPIPSAVLPVTFRLVSTDGATKVEVVETGGIRRWLCG